MDPDNGMVVIDSRLDGGIATYSCEDGFGVDGEAVLTCNATDGELFGVWMPAEPVCSRKYCLSFIIAVYQGMVENTEKWVGSKLNCTHAVISERAGTH